MLPKEIFTQISHFIVNYYLKSCIFFLHFILYLHVWIRIQKAPEQGSRSGSTTLLPPLVQCTPSMNGRVGMETLPIITPSHLLYFTMYIVQQCAVSTRQSALILSSAKLSKVIRFFIIFCIIYNLFKFFNDRYQYRYQFQFCGYTHGEVFSTSSRVLQRCQKAGERSVLQVQIHFILTATRA